MPSFRCGRVVTRGSLVALAICLAAAALEGLLAGRGVRAHLARLNQPRYSPPFAVWVGIGLCYYLICFIILTRLTASTRSAATGVAFALIAALLIGNAVWNLVFFRLKNLEASAIVQLAYIAIALMLAVVLTFVDPVSRWVFLPYVVYLAYATWWLMGLRRLNRTVRDDAA
jgi:tryptophan-rich sensory protein